MWAQAFSGSIKISQDITADSLEFITPVLLTGNTVLSAMTDGITAGSIDGTFDLDVEAASGITLGPLGGTAALKNVILDSAANVAIGSATTPLLVKALTLELFTSEATLDGAGLINGVAISKGNVKFNGAFNANPPALTFTSPPPPPIAPAETILIISGGGGADDLELSDGGDSICRFCRAKWLRHFRSRAGGADGQPYLAGAQSDHYRRSDR